MNIEFDDIEIALADFKLGIPLVVVDDEKRENEGDIIFPAASATSEKINFCVTHARGLVCVAISTSIASRLQLNKVPSNQSDLYGTAFLDSIDATPAFGITTGISAFDRATTAKQIANPPLLNQILVVRDIYFLFLQIQMAYWLVKDIRRQE